jgi:hypothetical protein
VAGGALTVVAIWTTGAGADAIAPAIVPLTLTAGTEAGLLAVAEAAGGSGTTLGAGELALAVPRAAMAAMATVGMMLGTDAVALAAGGLISTLPPPALGGATAKEMTARSASVTAVAVVAS